MLRAGGSGADAGVPVFSYLDSRFLNKSESHLAVVDGVLKLIRLHGREQRTKEESLYGLATDPGELRPIVEPSEARARLARLLDEFERLKLERSDKALNREQLDQLKALGYLN